jgi:hypothetical protein
MVAYVVRVTIACFEISAIYNSQLTYPLFEKMARVNDRIVK